MIKKLFTFLTVLCVFLGCTKDTRVQVPAYIEIDDYFTKVTKSRGTNNQNFTDMLVYANGQTYGTYPLGAKIPVLTSGPTNFIIRGVVRMNGVDILRPDYEVMKGSDTIINVTPGQVTRVVPVFEYFSTAKFPLIIDFDNTGNSTALDSGSWGPNFKTSCNCNTPTATTYSPGFGNYGYCLALRPNSDTTASVQTNAVIGLPSGGVGVYMELNYMSNVTIHVYVSSSGSNGLVDCGGIYPSATWKKMYLTLTEQISSLQSTTGYTIYLLAAYQGNAGGDLALIDNIKIVTAQ